MLFPILILSAVIVIGLLSVAICRSGASRQTLNVYEPMTDDEVQEYHRIIIEDFENHLS